MTTSTFKAKLAKAAAVALVVATGAGAYLATGSTAGADPKQFGTTRVVYGSDTIQDIDNALSGFANGKNYTPLQSSAATGQVQMLSWDATPVGSCITPKVGAPLLYRANGSSQGRRMLSRAIDGTNYGLVGAAGCSGGKPVGGLIDGARSSSGPANGDTGTELTYVPFGRDGVSFAYVTTTGATAVTSLTRAQLTTLFTTGPSNLGLGGPTFIPCGIQTSSGTYTFWNTVTTANATQENTATTQCNNYNGTGRLQENDGAGLTAKATAAPANSQLIVGFSAANYISQSNNVATPNLGSAVIGSISNNGSGVNLGSPVSGTAPNLTPNATFYDDTVFGRNVYHVFDTAIITGPGNNDLKSLFSGGTSSICQTAAQNTVNAFGFSSIATCGSTALKGSLISGQD